MTPRQEKAIDCKFFETGARCVCTERLLTLLLINNVDCEEWDEKFEKPCKFWVER